MTMVVKRWSAPRISIAASMLATFMVDAGIIGRVACAAVDQLAALGIEQDVGDVPGGQAAAGGRRPGLGPGRMGRQGGRQHQQQEQAEQSHHGHGPASSASGRALL